MESKLLMAAKEMEKWLAQNDGDVDLDSVLMTEFRYAIREAEAPHVCTYPADGAPCSVCHKPVTVAAPTPAKPDTKECYTCGIRCSDAICRICELHSNWRPNTHIVTPKPDPWACRLHPEGRCATIGDMVSGGSCSGIGFFEVCPWPSRQKPAPARRTKLDAVRDTLIKGTHALGVKTSIYHDVDDLCEGVCEAIGVRPEDEMEG